MNTDEKFNDTLNRCLEKLNKGLDYYQIPGHMRTGIREYVLYGKSGGSFQTAIFSDSLVKAFGKADDINRKYLEEYAMFLYWIAPSECWGSLEKVNQWIENGGLEGVLRKQLEAENENS
jgi:hypothetical protein